MYGSDTSLSDPDVASAFAYFSVFWFFFSAPALGYCFSASPVYIDVPRLASPHLRATSSPLPPLPSVAPIHPPPIHAAIHPSAHSPPSQPPPPHPPPQMIALNVYSVPRRSDPSHSFLHSPPSTRRLLPAFRPLRAPSAHSSPLMFPPAAPRHYSPPAVPYFPFLSPLLSSLIPPTPLPPEPQIQPRSCYSNVQHLLAYHDSFFSSFHVLPST